MVKLLYANFSRLFQDKIFYAELILTAILSEMIVFADYSPKIQATGHNFRHSAGGISGSGGGVNHA